MQQIPQMSKWLWNWVTEAGRALKCKLEIRMILERDEKEKRKTREMASSS